VSQPSWKLLWATDCQRLLIDETGVYAPELEHADEVCDAPEKERFMVYRIELDGPLVLVDGRLRDEYGHRPWFEDDSHKVVPGEHTDHRFCQPCGSWISNNLTSAAECCGMDPDDLRSLFCSSDPNERSEAYEAIASTHGWDNFDSYPLIMSEAELDARWEKDQ
jgi:hypothetical protein